MPSHAYFDSNTGRSLLHDAAVGGNADLCILLLSGADQKNVQLWLDNSYCLVKYPVCAAAVNAWLGQKSSLAAVDAAVQIGVCMPSFKSSP